MILASCLHQYRVEHTCQLSKFSNPLWHSSIPGTYTYHSFFPSLALSFFNLDVSRNLAYDLHTVHTLVLPRTFPTQIISTPRQELSVLSIQVQSPL